MTITTETTLKSTTALSGAGLPWPLHPACAAWPDMSPSDLRNLADDIAENGLRDPVTLTPDNLLLDGKNRASAAIMAGVDPAATATVHHGDPWLFSLSRNKHRRHLTTDQLALVAANLVTTTQGMNQNTVGSNELTVAKAAEVAGVSETSIKSARAVITHGTPEEVEAINLGRVPLRKTADRIRSRRRALAPPAVPKPMSKPAQPDADPIDAAACDIIAKCWDGKPRSAAKIATVVKVAETAAREALKRLGDSVSQHKNGSVIEYRLGGNDPVLLSRLLAAKDQEIADLKNRIVEQDAEIARLMEMLTAPSASATPARKKQRAKPESDSTTPTVN